MTTRLMATRLMATMAIAVASAVSFSGCTRPPPIPPTPPLRGGESYEIKDCKDKYVPTTVYKITISQSFELRYPDVVKSTKPAKEISPGEYDEDYSAKDGTYNGVSDSAIKTRLDIDVGLQKAGDAAMIKIILADPLLKFRADDAKIRGGGPNGRDMLCSVRLSSDERSIRFIVFYYKKDKDKPTYGKYNIGLTATDKDTTSGYTLPIYIDPMIKNNG